MIKNKVLLSLVAVSMLALGACASKGDKTASTPPPSDSSAYNSTAGAGTQLGNADEDARAAAERALTNNIVYFDRSEEHTSELQSLMRISYAVFCLKTKKQRKKNIQHQHKQYNNKTHIKK